jgi:hypothetical protein
MASLPYSKTTKEKLESLFQHAGYRVRYEKGNFSAGYCLVKDQKVAVVNKYFDLEGRIDTLSYLITQIAFDEAGLDQKLLRFYKQLIKSMNDPLYTEVKERKEIDNALEKDNIKATDA